MLAVSASIVIENVVFKTKKKPTYSKKYELRYSKQTIF